MILKRFLRNKKWRFLLCGVFTVSVAVSALTIHDDITFELIDLDGNGVISYSEVKEIASGREGAEALFVFVDRDGGGFVDEYEFDLFKEQLEEYLSRKNTTRSNTGNLRLK